MENTITFELLFDRIKALESNVEKLQKEILVLKKKINENSSNRVNRINRNLQSLISFLEENGIEEKGHIQFSCDEVIKGANIEIDDPLMIEKKFGKLLETKSNYFIYGSWLSQSTGEKIIEFAVRPKKGMREIVDYIKSLIENSKEDFINITALQIHKELKLISRMPTVCKAMEKLIDKKTDRIIGEGKLSSTYTVRYKTGKRTW